MSFSEENERLIEMASKAELAERGQIVDEGVQTQVPEEAESIRRKPQPARDDTRMIGNSLIGLMLAWGATSIWIYFYLSSTGVGIGLLSEYVMGTRVGSSAFQSTEALFVVITRFIFGTGLLWAPLTFLVTSIRRRR